MAQTTIYQLKTFVDLYTAVREELKLQSTDSTATQRIQRDLNIIYLDEVIPYSQWKWLRGTFDTTMYSYINAGTANVSLNSNTVTLSTAIAASKKGWLFSVLGYSEVYKIAQHANNSKTLVLEAPYTGTTSTNQTYQIWTDELYLPSFVRETFQIRHDFNDQVLTNCGLQEFKSYVASLPKAQGRPYFYTTNLYADPMEYTVPSGMPAVTSRSSDTINKTVTFASDVSNFINQGDRIQISSAGDSSYNGTWVVASQTTNVITFTATVPIFESTTSDIAMVVAKLQPSSDSRRQRRINIYPALFTQNTTLHIDYIREVPPLQNDNDEPLMPIGDRTVLLYGALHRAWSRERNPEEADRNLKLFQAKLSRMAGKIDDSIDQVRLVPNKVYLGSKRMAQRQKDTMTGLPESWGGSPTAGGNQVSGTANTIATFNSNGQLSSGLPGGTAGYPLISNGTALPSYQQINLGSSVGITGQLPLTNLATIANSTLLGNVSGGTATPSALTVTQVNTLLGTLTNPMSALGDTIYGGGAGTPTKLSGNSTTTKNFLTQTGSSTSSQAPAWGTIAGSDLPNPSASTLGGIQSFASSANAFINAISTLGVPSAVQVDFINLGGIITPSQCRTPTVQTFSSSGSGTYTPPASPAPLYIKVRGLGGGGGGAGSGSSGPGAGGNGGNTLFGSILTANGGAGGTASGGPADAGGTATGGSINIQGGSGTGPSGGGTDIQGGNGGCSVFGGGGAGGAAGANGANGSPNSGGGAGGGGGAGSTVVTGGGGGAGGYFEKIITSSAYSYTVAQGGSAGAAGAGGSLGGAGGSGFIIVEEFYQ